MQSLLFVPVIYKHFLSAPPKTEFFLDSAAVVIGPPRYVLHRCKQRRSFFLLNLQKRSDPNKILIVTLVLADTIVSTK